ncbi:MAG: SDR family oxidoreductase [Actinobacteria bacterium]|nr:SDR family oxidoreductase [Actinomycetota bacterium]
MSGSGRLAGKRALVTGGASGIGAAIVERFRGEGAAVFVADLAGGDAVCDVRSRESVEAAIAAAAGRLGGLDTLVLNAGRPVVGTVDGLDEAEWDDGIATNLTSLYLCSKAAWPHLAAAGGSISITASVVGIWGSPNQAAYCASKAAAIMLAKCMALDGAKLGIRVNCVGPGFVETPMLERFLAEQDDPEAVRAGAIGLHPLGRLGRPRDVADAFVYLASDEAAWVTGTTLSVDGGLTAGIWGG